MKKIFWNELGLEIYDSDIDKSHRLKQKHLQNESKPRQVIIKLLSHDLKNYFSKKKVKSSKFLITESLTSTSYVLFWYYMTVNFSDINETVIERCFKFFVIKLIHKFGLFKFINIM